MEKYDKKSDCTYVNGPFAVFKVLDFHRDLIDCIYYHESFTQKDELLSRALHNGVKILNADKKVIQLSNRKNDYVIARVKKVSKKLNDSNHIILENIENMGNLGTILRTMAAFDYENLALIGNVCDYFNPKVIRASMGSFFDVRIEHFNSLKEYKKRFKRDIYAFYLREDAKCLREVKAKTPFSLAFGNEGTGLTDDFLNEKSVIIEQSDKVDSMSIQIACAVSMYYLR